MHSRERQEVQVPLVSVLLKLSDFEPLVDSTFCNPGHRERGLRGLLERWHRRRHSWHWRRHSGLSRGNFQHFNSMLSKLRGGCRVQGRPCKCRYNDHRHRQEQFGGRHVGKTRRAAGLIRNRSQIKRITKASDDLTKVPKALSEVCSEFSPPAEILRFYISSMTVGFGPDGACRARLAPDMKSACEGVGGARG